MQKLVVKNTFEKPIKSSNRPTSEKSKSNFLLKFDPSILGTLANKTERDNTVVMSTKMKKVVAYINHNYQNNLLLKNLAQQAELSIFHFSRTFKEETGKSPYKYLTDYRINASKNLLKSTKKSISTIAEEVGFRSSASFSISFKKTTGLSPRQYRKNG